MAGSFANKRAKESFFPMYKNLPFCKSLETGKRPMTNKIIGLVGGSGDDDIGEAKAKKADRQILYCAKRD